MSHEQEFFDSQVFFFLICKMVIIPSYLHFRLRLIKSNDICTQTGGIQMLRVNTLLIHSLTMAWEAPSNTWARPPVP